VSLQWRKRVVVCGAMAHWLVAWVSRFYILGVSIKTDDICLKQLLLPTEMHSTRGYTGGPTHCHRRWLALVVLAGSGRSCSRYLDGDSRRWSMDLRHKGRMKPTPPKSWNPSSVHVWPGEKSGVSARAHATYIKEVS
jgi:hypothetical protein